MVSRYVIPRAIRLTVDVLRGLVKGIHTDWAAQHRHDALVIVYGFVDAYFFHLDIFSMVAFMLSNMRLRTSSFSLSSAGRITGRGGTDLPERCTKPNSSRRQYQVSPPGLPFPAPATSPAAFAGALLPPNTPTRAPISCFF